MVNPLLATLAPSSLAGSSCTTSSTVTVSPNTLLGSVFTIRNPIPSVSHLSPLHQLPSPETRRLLSGMRLSLLHVCPHSVFLAFRSSHPLLSIHQFLTLLTRVRLSANHQFLRQQSRSPLPLWLLFPQSRVPLFLLPSNFQISSQG